MSIYELIQQIITAFKYILFPWTRPREEPDVSHME